MARATFVVSIIFVLSSATFVQCQSIAQGARAAEDIAKLLQDLTQRGKYSNFLLTNGTEWLKATVKQIQDVTSVVNEFVTCIQSSVASNTSNPLCFYSAMEDLVAVLPPGLFNSTDPQDVLTGLSEMWDVLETTLSNLTNPMDLLNVVSLLRSPIENNTGIQSFVSGLNAMRDAVNPICRQHFLLMLGALSQRKMWALEMLDAAGKPGAGILEGNWAWYGSYDQCKEVSATLATGAELEGKYCLVNVPVPIPIPQAQAIGIPFLSLSIGVCLPDSCTADDITRLLYNVAPIKKAPPSADCRKQIEEFSPAAIAMIVVSSSFALVMVIATAFDIILVQMNANLMKSHAKKEKKKENVTFHGVIQNDGLAGVYTKKDGLEQTNIDASEVVQNGTEETEIKMEKYNEQKPEPATIKPGMFGKMLLSFSLYTNIPKLLSAKQGSESLRAVNGIRFLSMTWVILGHTYSFGLTYGDNGLTYFFKELTHRLSFMAILNAMVSVDTFFALSGLLVTYLSLKEIKKQGGLMRFNWGLYYFHRFWRLTPAYMLILGMLFVTGYLSSGPRWPVAEFEENNACPETWWTNLLYVNNLVKTDKLCMGWSWYLANDMQFFVLTPLLLVPLFLSGIFGLIVCLIFLGVVSAVTGVLSQQHNYPTSMITGGGGDDNKFFQNIYIKPYCRMGPYIVGVLTGYILYRTKCKIRIPKIVVIVGWLVAAGACLAVLYGIYDPDKEHVPSSEVAALYNAVHRTVWGIGVCWVILACATGHGGIVNRILSWPALVPLSRLTYCAYLVHPVVVTNYFNSIRVPIHFSDYSMIYIFVANLVLSYMVAFCASLAFESPMMGMEKVLLRRETRK